ncbi:MAG: YbjN domain-containing protein [Deltaproteobacteria bacterium]|nr:YbjN domain-containing protein [Deltaproteobacteria bacterium]
MTSTEIISEITTQLDGFFDEYGWQFEKSEEQLFRTGFVGETGQYDIWIRLTEHWVYFIIHPFVKPVTDPMAKAEVCRVLLEANFAINMAKFAMDETGEVSLSVELPVSGFRYSHFSDALTAISHYADDHRAEFETACDQTGASWQEVA